MITGDVPTWATGTVAEASAAIVVSLSSNTDALVTLFTAATLLPAILYTATVLVYWRTVRRDPGPRAGFRLARPAQRYVLAALGLGLLVYGWLWATDPTALTTQPTPPPPRRGQESVWAAAEHKPAPS